MNDSGARVVGGLGVLAVAAFLGLGVKTISTQPPSTVALFDPKTETYVTEACFEAGTAAGAFLVSDPTNNLEALQEGTLGDFRKRGRPDPVCRDAGGFEAGQSNMTIDTLRWLRRVSYSMF